MATRIQEIKKKIQDCERGQGQMDSGPGQVFLHDRLDQLVRIKEKEELQATLLKLRDLQHQLEDLQSENKTLGESLSQQTEKLEACRQEKEFAELELNDLKNVVTELENKYQHTHAEKMELRTRVYAVQRDNAHLQV